MSTLKLGRWSKLSIDDTTQSLSFGPIEAMQVPQGWLSGNEGQNPESAATEITIHPAESPQVSFTFFYRGFSISKESGKNFAALLANNAHDLNEEEKDEIQQALDSLALKTAFAPEKFATRNLNGKMVLEITGLWQANQDHYIGIMVDATGTGQELYEVFLSAPKAEFEKYLPEYKASLDSIVWSRD
ncbi:MAG: hypothetical protein K2X81_24945 [Candidatus Obscuribacterales bacterium]|nr:hypothetical protein [Candidatus Obscuribacterales bacterium]